MCARQSARMISLLAELTRVRKLHLCMAHCRQLPLSDDLNDFTSCLAPFFWNSLEGA
jgi:hypothetical protein